MAQDADQQFGIIQQLPLSYPRLSQAEKMALDAVARRRLRVEAWEQGFEVLADPEVEAIIAMVHVWDTALGQYVPKQCDQVPQVLGCDYVERWWRAPVRQRQGWAA